MIPQANITAWRASASWPDDAQVEQDLVLTRALVQLFSEPKLTGKIALRGGTALHKLFLRPASRYSEDIDLVQTEAGPIGAILDTCRANLDPWLGKPTRSRAEGSVSLVYRFDSEIPPVRPLRLKIEINTREHFTVLGFARRPVAVENPWYTGEAEVVTFEVDELLGTKLRALYQRRKGRDLFDLWLSIGRGVLDPERVVACFAEYMHQEGHSVSRAQYEQNLHDKQTDRAFLEDIQPLLRTDVDYDAAAALKQVHEVIIQKLPGAPWRGPGEEPTGTVPRSHDGDEHEFKGLLRARRTAPCGRTFGLRSVPHTPFRADECAAGTALGQRPMLLANFNALNAFSGTLRGRDSLATAKNAVKYQPPAISSTRGAIAILQFGKELGSP